MKAIFTLDCGYSFPVELELYGGVDTRRPEELEKLIVKRFNLSQPNMVHKVAKCHLFRN